MIRIRKLDPGDMPKFPRRWVVEVEADHRWELCNHVSGYFYTWEGAMEWAEAVS